MNRNKQLKDDSGGDLQGKTEPVLHGCCPGIAARQRDYSILNNNIKNNTTRTHRYPCVHARTHLCACVRTHMHACAHRHTLCTDSPFSCAPLSNMIHVVWFPWHQQCCLSLNQLKQKGKRGGNIQWQLIIKLRLAYLKRSLIVILLTMMKWGRDHMRALHTKSHLRTCKWRRN